MATHEYWIYLSSVLINNSNIRSVGLWWSRKLGWDGASKDFLHSSILQVRQTFLSDLNLSGSTIVWKGQTVNLMKAFNNNIQDCQQRKTQNRVLLTLKSQHWWKLFSGHSLSSAVSSNLPEEVQDVLGPVSGANSLEWTFTLNWKLQFCIVLSLLHFSELLFSELPKQLLLHATKLVSFGCHSQPYFTAKFETYT